MSRCVWRMYIWMLDCILQRPAALFQRKTLRLSEHVEMRVFVVCLIWLIILACLIW